MLSSQRGQFGSRYRARGRHRGRNRWTSPSFRQQPAIREPAEAELGEVIATIYSHDLEDPNNGDGAARISNCQYLTSYNWLEEKNPSILIPGNAPVPFD